VNTGKVAGRVQTTVFVVDGSADVALRSAATTRSVKVEGSRKLTVDGKILGTARALSAPESSRLLAQLRYTTPQHLNAPSAMERWIGRHGRAEAAKQAKLVAEQVKQASVSRQASVHGSDLSRGDRAASSDTAKAGGPDNVSVGSGGSMTGGGGSGATGRGGS